jgi:hypothetical protein
MRTVPEAMLDLDVLVGGMGVDISSVELVSTVASDPSGRFSGSLSATGLTDVYARLLQLGDDGGVVRKAFDAFRDLVPSLADDVERLYRKYYVPGGKGPTEMLKGFSIAGPTPPRDVQIFTVLATYAHVWRTKALAPHRPVGVNFLRKIERMLLYGLYGAMLAGADWVVVGAGDPGDVPGILDDLARNQPVALPIKVATVPHGEHTIRFDPRELVGPDLPPPARPAFLAIARPRPWRPIRRPDPKVSWWRARRPGDTTRLPGTGNGTGMGATCTDPRTTPTWARCGRWVCRSGSLAGTVGPKPRVGTGRT